jgi:hypothetical protein
MTSTELTTVADPKAIVAHQRRFVEAMRDEILRNHTIEMDGKRYVKVAGGTAIANALGLTVMEQESDFIAETPDLPAHWRAIAIVVDAAGVTRGRGCGRVFLTERRWGNAEPYAAAAMAGTRAAARALRYVLGHYYIALGAADTPSEEMEMVIAERQSPRPASPRPESPRPASPAATAAFRNEECVVTAVDQHRGSTNGRDWVKFKIHTDRGTLTTFNGDIAKVAESALASGVAVIATAKAGRHGLDAVSMKLAEASEAVLEAVPMNDGVEDWNP